MLNSIRNNVPLAVRRKLRQLRAAISLRKSGHFVYFGQPVFASMNSVIVERIMREGVFEPEILSAMDSFSAQDSCVFDVGANIGVMSVALLAKRQDLRCVSIECSPFTFPLLRKTQQISSWKERWTIVEAAASDANGTVSFYTSGADRGAYDGLEDTGRGGATQEVSVTAKTIDNIWLEVGKPQVSMIKIDVEGGETLAIRGARLLVETCRPTIIFEWNQDNLKPYGLDAHEIFNLGLPSYDVFALPSLVKVRPQTVRALMAQTEMFAAVPRT